MPNNMPSMAAMKVTKPMIRAGARIVVFRKPKLSPTTRESMLVATAAPRRTRIFVGSN